MLLCQPKPKIMAPEFCRYGMRGWAGECTDLSSKRLLYGFTELFYVEYCRLVVCLYYCGGPYQFWSAIITIAIWVSRIMPEKLLWLSFTNFLKSYLGNDIIQISLKKIRIFSLKFDLTINIALTGFFSLFFSDMGSSALHCYKKN